MCVPSGFGESIGSDVSMGYVFPQIFLAATTLVESKAGDRKAIVRFRCEPGLHLYSMAVTAPLGVESGPEVLEQKP